MKTVKNILLVIAAVGATLSPAWARDIEYKNQEVAVFVNPGEPTQLRFPGNIAGGFKRRASSLALDRRGSDLVLFANDDIPPTGEALLVRLDDGRSYSIRVKRTDESSARDEVVRIEDSRAAVLDAEEEEAPPFKEKEFQYAPANQISGFMREIILVGEFGKASIPGYRITDKYRGEVVLADGTLRATIDQVIVGPNYWGYILDVENLLETTQRLNPATFRLDGTRAVSLQHFELAPRPLNVEQDLARRHTTKAYIITRKRSLS